MSLKKEKWPKISIIIPVYLKTPYVLESIKGCQELDYPDFEILVAVDKDLKLAGEKVRLIKTGQKRTGPAEKRDLAIEKAKGEYIALLDDDSYPERDWLRQAVFALKANPKAKAVCGPGLTPPTDSFPQKLSGAILTSFFGSGIYVYRFRQEPSRLVDDYPAYNMMVKKSVLKKVGGFGTKFYGGEDTALCLKLINAGEKILYIPEMIVYHHRRNFPQGFFHQISNVGKHRGYFVKRYPQTSRKLIYFLPALTLLALPLILVSGFLSRLFLYFFLILAFFSYLVIFGDGLRRNSFLVALALPFAVGLTHSVYAFNFINGLLTSKLTR